jgi:hypothetical protein
MKTQNHNERNKFFTVTINRSEEHFRMVNYLYSNQIYF